MADIVMQGVDSINDFWCYVNDDKGKSHVVPGDGTKTVKIPVGDLDFIAVYVRYFLQDFHLFNIERPAESHGKKFYLVRDHLEVSGKYRYYCWGLPLYEGLA